MAAQDDINVIIIKHDESPIEVYSDNDILVLRGLRHARKTFRVPRFFINLAHKFRVKLNPIYSDENYDTDIFTTIPLEEIIKIMQSWGCITDDPNQYMYSNQVGSGHMSFINGRQLHIRVYKHPDGRYSLKAHAEWDGLVRPIMHIMYAGLDYEKGYKILKRLWQHSKKQAKNALGD